jgi:hypothetical protein
MVQQKPGILIVDDEKMVCDIPQQAEGHSR